MKRQPTRNLLHLILLTVLCFLTACNGSTEASYDLNWTPQPVNVLVDLQDKQGNDLLNARTQGNILGQDISMVFNNVAYELLDSKTDTLSAQTLALRLKQNTQTGRYYMSFGPFEAQENVQLREMTLRLPQEKEVRLGYSHSFAFTSEAPIQQTLFFYEGHQIPVADIIHLYVYDNGVINIF